MTDKIEITREQFREHVGKLIKERGWHENVLLALEAEFFGSKKPLEIFVVMQNDVPFKPLQISKTEYACIEYHGDPPPAASIRWIKFREVLDDK